MWQTVGLRCGAPGHLLVAAAASFMAAAGPLAAQERSGGVDLEAAAREVEAREIAFAKTMADRDLAAFESFVAEEGVFFAGDAPLRGRQAVAEGWARFFEDPEPPFSWHPELVEVLASGDLALSAGPVLDPAGEVVGRFNSIWRKGADGVWRVVFDKGCPP